MADKVKKSQYDRLGVGAGKEDVHGVFSGKVRQDFPGAFVNIVRSALFPGYVSTQHPDGDGSKSILRLLMYKITQDKKWLYGMVDDAWSMNFGDVACAGFVGGEFMVTDVLNLNRFNVPRQLILEVIEERVAELIKLYADHGIGTIHFMGGETADLPRQAQTTIFDITASATMKESCVVKGNVQSGDRIWGLASNGQASWEDTLNSGIMSNGLTLAVTKLIHYEYSDLYPEVLIPGNTFEGRCGVDYQSGISGMSVAEALLSPTRHWAIFIKMLIDELNARGLFHLLHGIAMNTGGGATKLSNLGPGGICYRKRMPIPPELFQLVQRESREGWRDMFKGLNCGVGLDVVGHEDLGPILEEVSKRAQIVLCKLGHCETWDSNRNQVVLETLYGRFEYEY